MDANDDTLDILTLVHEERERQDKLKAKGKFTFTCADVFGLMQAEKLGVLAEEFGEVAQLVCRVMIPAPGHVYETDEGPVKVIPDLTPEQLQDYRVKLKEELIQVAAVCVAWAETL